MLNSVKSYISRIFQFYDSWDKGPPKTLSPRTKGVEPPVTEAAGLSCQDMVEGMIDIAHDGQKLAPHPFVHHSPQ